MSVSDGYLEYVCDQLSTFGGVSARKMFGGAGIYCEGAMFALIDDGDRFYLKADDRNRPDFEERGMGPFRPYGGKSSMSYYEVPDDVLENGDLLAAWATKALDAARRAKARKGKGRNVKKR